MYQLEDVNLANHYFGENVTEILEDMVPLRKVQPGGRNKTWVIDMTRDLMRERDTWREKVRTTQCPDNWDKYRVNRNKCSDAILKDKRNYYEARYSEFSRTSNTSELYRVTRKQMGGKDGGSPSTFLVNGKLQCSPSVLTETKIQ